MMLTDEERITFALRGGRDAGWWDEVQGYPPLARATLRSADRRFRAGHGRGVFLDAVGGRAVRTPVAHEDLNLPAPPGVSFGCAVSSRVLRFVLDALPGRDVSVAWLGRHWPVPLDAGEGPAVLMPLKCCDACGGAPPGMRWNDEARCVEDCPCRDCVAYRRGDCAVRRRLEAMR